MLNLSEVVVNEEKFVNVICPICKAKKEIKIPSEVINKSKQLTTISIPGGNTCSHHFQLFIDKNYKIRGYQKVDFELNTNKSKNTSMDLHQIYEEFWDFIDDENQEFKNYILKDKRRNGMSNKKTLFVKEILTENIHKSPT